MAYPTVYARIVPTDGVSGDKYSVSVTGVTATVEGQKTWTSGTLNFAITPSSLGTMVVTFKNDTLNKTIGTKSIVVSALNPYNENQVGVIWATPYDGYDAGSEDWWLVYGIYENQQNDGWVSQKGVTLPNGCVCDFFSMNVSTHLGGSNVWVEFRYVSGTKPSNLTVTIVGVGATTLNWNSLNSKDDRMVYMGDWSVGATRVKKTGTKDTLTFTV